MSNKLRFPEFRNSWETRKIESFVTEMRGGASLTPSEILESGDYKIIPKKSIQAGGKIVIDDDCSYVTEEVFNKFENNQVDKSYLLVVLRDLVPTGPSIGYIVENDKVDNGILAQGVYGIKLSEELDEKYLIQFSNTPKYRRIMQKIMVGSTQVHIRNTTFLNVEIPYTCLEEQQKIADFLSHIDDVITASEQEVAALEEQKKGAMQKIFSQEVRFKADDGSEYPEWEEKRLEEIGEFYGGLSGKTKDDFGKGEDKYITYMNVYKNTFAKNELLDTVIISENEKQNRVKYGDVLFTQSSETVEGGRVNICIFIR